MSNALKNTRLILFSCIVNFLLSTAIFAQTDNMVTLLTPVNGQVLKYGLNKTWYFDWEDIPGAGYYQILIEDGNKNLLLNTYTSTNSSNYTFTLESLIPEHLLKTIVKQGVSYKLAGWWVRAKIGDGWGKWSKPHTIYMEMTKPLPAPYLISPASNAQMTNGRADKSQAHPWKFDWQDVANAGRYQIEVGNSIRTNQRVTVYSNSSELSLGYLNYFNYGYYVPNNELSGWFWRVRVEINGEWGPWSETRTFSIQPSIEDKKPVPAPVLFAPNNGATLSNGNADNSSDVRWQFDWQDVPGASEYNIYVKHSGSDNPLLNKFTVKSNYFFIRMGYIANSKLYDWRWKVRAKVGGVWGEWSEERYFNVTPPNETKITPEK